MIGWLEGRVVDVRPGEVVIEAGGVGYELRVPVSAHALLHGQDEVALFVHTHVREDQISLFGFPTRRERDTFRILIGVSGIGPRTALALLSGLPPEELAQAIEGEQWQRLAGVPGIGRRTAERVIVELKGKLQPGSGSIIPSLREDAVSALINLGYSLRTAEDTVAGVLRAEPGLELVEVLRRVLRTLTKG